MRHHPIFHLTLLSLILLWGNLILTQAQDDDIVLTLSLSPGLEFLEENHIFDAFEAQNPGVRVHVLYREAATRRGNSFVWRFPPVFYGLEAHLDGLEDYTGSADVMIASIGHPHPVELTLVGTRAGYFLDLAPLIQVDETFNADTFYPATWQSVHWDGGIWMLPLTAQVYTLCYDPTAFDAAGLDYPNENWTLDHYVHAIEDLTQRDNTGRAIVPGFIGFNGGDFALFYSLLGQGAYDETIVPNPPQIDRSDVVDFFGRWARLYASGAAYNSDYDYVDDIKPSDTPLLIDTLPRTFPFQSTPPSQTMATLLPGGTAWITVAGVTVSSRSQYPEEAYALAKFMADDPRIADAFTMVSTTSAPARQVYPDVEPIENAPRRLDGLSPENEELQETALRNGITYPQVRYLDYVRKAFWTVPEGGDVQAMLQEAQVAAENALEEAGRRREHLSGFVPPPPPEIVLAPGEISLTFGIEEYGSLNNREEWERFVAAILADDPEIAQIVLDVGSGVSMDPDVDCYYLPYTGLAYLDLDTVLSLDPLMSVDADFDTDDLMTGVWPLVQRENHTWAYPLDIQPMVLWYDPEAFSLAGISFPAHGWSVNDFDAAMHLLDEQGESPVFGAMYETSLLQLIAAYGGLPIDFRTDPPTIDFTSPESVEAIRQVLNLAKEGLIYYEEPLAGWGSTPWSGNEPLFANTLSVSPFNRAEYRPVTFPVGSQLVPVSYELGTAYISADSPYPEACYRVISQLSSHPELLFGMPVRRSLADDPTIAVAQGQDLVDFYGTFEAMLDSANVVVFPPNSSLPSDFIAQYWLFRAFDRYVLEHANLENELAEAERFTLEYLDCTTTIPAFDGARQSYRDYHQQFEDCAIGVDPTSRSYFAFGE